MDYETGIRLDTILQQQARILEILEGETPKSLTPMPPQKQMRTTKQPRPQQPQEEAEEYDDSPFNEGEMPPPPAPPPGRKKGWSR